MNIKELNNEEHREAHQQTLDRANERTFGAERLKVVKECLDKLSEHGIGVDAFLKIPRVDGEETDMGYYHNYEKDLKFEGGKLSKESQIQACRHNHEFINMFISHISSNCCNKSNDWNLISSFMAHTVNNWRRYKQTGEELPEIKQIKMRHR